MSQCARPAAGVEPHPQHGLRRVPLSARARQNGFRGVLLHRRGAHERVLFEEAQTALDNGAVESQPLLAARTLELAPQEYALALQYLDVMRTGGIGVEDFGSNTLKIDALPAMVGDVDPVAFVGRVLADLRDEEGATGGAVQRRVLLALSRHASAAVGEATRERELQSLLKRLLSCEQPFTDPRGRPTLVQFSHQELARRFGLRA